MPDSSSSLAPSRVLTLVTCLATSKEFSSFFFWFVSIHLGPWWLAVGGLQETVCFKAVSHFRELLCLETDFLLLRFPERSFAKQTSNNLRSFPNSKVANLAHFAKFDKSVNLLLCFPCNFYPQACSCFCFFFAGKRRDYKSWSPTPAPLGQLHCRYLKS